MLGHTQDYSEMGKSMIRSFLWKLIEPLVQAAIDEQISAFDEELAERRQKAETARQELSVKLRAALRQLGPIELLPSQASYREDVPQHPVAQQPPHPIAQHQRRAP